MFTEDYKILNIFFDSETIYEDPTIYINITSKHIKEDALRKENWFMINVPSVYGQIGKYGTKLNIFK
jgi:hypothetical protein